MYLKNLKNFNNNNSTNNNNNNNTNSSSNNANNNGVTPSPRPLWKRPLASNSPTTESANNSPISPTSETSNTTAATTGGVVRNRTRQSALISNTSPMLQQQQQSNDTTTKASAYKRHATKFINPLYDPYAPPVAYYDSLFSSSSSSSATTTTTTATTTATSNHHHTTPFNNKANISSSTNNNNNSVITDSQGIILSKQQIDVIHKTYKPLLDMLLFNEVSRCYFLFSICSIANVNIRESILTSVLLLLNQAPHNAAITIESLISFDTNRPDTIKRLIDTSTASAPFNQDISLSVAQLQQQNVRSARTNGKIELLNALNQQQLLSNQNDDSSDPHGSSNGGAHGGKSKNKLLSGDSPSQRLLKLYNRMFGGAYLRAVFHGTMDLIHYQQSQPHQHQQQHMQQQQDGDGVNSGNGSSMDNGSMNNSGTSSGDVDTMHCALRIATLLMQNIEKSVPVLPVYLRQICIQISKQNRIESMNLYHLSNVIFRHFVCPAITLPENYQLWPHESPPSIKQRQILVAVSKLFLRLLPARSGNSSNSGTDGVGKMGRATEVDSVLSSEVQQFVDKYRSVVHSFLYEISADTDIERSKSPVSTQNITYDIGEMEKLHKALSEHFCYFPVLDQIGKYSEVSHTVRALEIKQVLKSVKTRDQYVQIAQKIGKVVLPLTWVKTQSPLINQKLGTIGLDYDDVSDKQVQKDLQRDSIKVNNKLFQNNTDTWGLVKYMMSMFGYTGLPDQLLAEFVLGILQKTGRTSGGGDSYDATVMMLGDHENVFVTPDSVSMSDHPLTVTIKREGSEVIIDTSLKNFYKITDKNTYHEQHSVWFKVRATVKWRFTLSTMHQNIVDAGQVVLEPDASNMEPHCRILAGSPADQVGRVAKPCYLEKLQQTLYDIEVQERERRRSSKFQSFLSANLNKK